MPACFLYDARAGVTPADQTFADILRKKNANVLLAANKAEGAAAEAGVIEGFGLGLGTPLRLSAEHGEGMAELAVMLDPLIAAKAEGVPLTDVDVTAPPIKPPAANCSGRPSQCR